MKKLILDYSKWRCGGDKPSCNKLGTGSTKMLNDDGFRCCLGIFSPQLEGTISDIDLLGSADPLEVSSYIGNRIPLLSEYFENSSVNSDLSIAAIGINDDSETTPEQKIKLLQDLFAKEGYEIEVINKP